MAYLYVVSDILHNINARQDETLSDDSGNSLMFELRRSIISKSF